MLGLMLGRRHVLRDAVSAVDEKVRQRVPASEILLSLDAAREPLRRFLRPRIGGSRPATALSLKLLNLLLAKYHFLGHDTSVMSRPLGLLVDPSNGCNLACPGCVQSSRAKSLQLFDWKNGLLTVNRFATLLERYGPYMMQVMFCNYG